MLRQITFFCRELIPNIFLMLKLSLHFSLVNDLSSFFFQVEHQKLKYFFFIFHMWPCAARDVAVQKIETIIKEQFAVEMKNKEHEIEVIDQV